MAKKAKLKLWYVGTALDWGDAFFVEARTKLEAQDKAIDLALASLKNDLDNKGLFFDLTTDIEEVLE